MLIQGPGICWTTSFAEMILDWIRKILEQGFEWNYLVSIPD